MRFQPKALSNIFMLGLAMAILAQTALAKEFNWNQWKGPDQNGISRESNWDAQALNKPLKMNWKKKIGPGYSNISVQDGYLYALGYDKKKKKNTLYCLDVKTGKEIWTHSTKATKGQYEGPKTTPVINEGRVYTFSQDGDMLCQDAKTGKVIWKKQAVKDFGAEVLRWRIASSVLIEGDLAIYNALSSGLALNKKTGKLVWKSKPGQGNYASPVSFQSGKDTLVAVAGREDVYALHPQTGKIKWSFPWPSQYSIIAADPVLLGDQVFMSSGYGNGSALFDLSSGRPKQVWRHRQVSTHFSTAISIGEYLYAVSGNAGTNASLVCLKTSSGKVQWSEELGFGNMIAANGFLIFVNEGGSVYIIKANPEKYELVSSASDVLGGTCWTAPVLCNATLYVKNNKGDLVSLNVGK